MSHPEQQRAAPLAEALGLDVDEALRLRRELARSAKARLRHVAAGDFTRRLVDFLEKAAKGDPETALEIALGLGCGGREAFLYSRAAAKHFLEQAEQEAGSQRQPAAWLADALKRARQWRSEAERTAVDQAISEVAEAYGLATGQPEILSDSLDLEGLRKRMRLLVPRD